VDESSDEEDSSAGEAASENEEESREETDETGDDPETPLNVKRQQRRPIIDRRRRNSFVDDEAEEEEWGSGDEVVNMNDYDMEDSFINDCSQETTITASQDVSTVHCARSDKSMAYFYKQSLMTPSVAGALKFKTPALRGAGRYKMVNLRAEKYQLDEGESSEAEEVNGLIEDEGDGEDDDGEDLNESELQRTSEEDEEEKELRAVKRDDELRGRSPPKRNGFRGGRSCANVDTDDDYDYEDSFINDDTIVLKKPKAKTKRNGGRRDRQPKSSVESPIDDKESKLPPKPKSRLKRVALLDSDSDEADGDADGFTNIVAKSKHDKPQTSSSHSREDNTAASSNVTTNLGGFRWGEVYPIDQLDCPAFSFDIDWDSSDSLLEDIIEQTTESNANTGKQGTNKKEESLGTKLSSASSTSHDTKPTSTDTSSFAVPIPKPISPKTNSGILPSKVFSNLASFKPKQNSVAPQEKSTTANNNTANTSSNIVRNANSANQRRASSSTSARHKASIDCPRIAMDTRNVGNSQIATALRVKEKIDVVVRSTLGCDFCVSNRSAVERKLASEMRTAQNSAKIKERIKALLGTFERVYIIIEKDRVKAGTTERDIPMSRYQANLMTQLSLVEHIILLDSNGQEQTASILAQLCRSEAALGHQIQSIQLISASHQETFLKLLSTMDGMTYPVAMDIVHKFKTLQAFVNSPLGTIRAQLAYLPRLKVDGFYFFLRKRVQVGMLPSDD